MKKAMKRTFYKPESYLEYTIPRVFLNILELNDYYLMRNIMASGILNIII
jgi:hypothetical protein